METKSLTKSSRPTPASVPSKKVQVKAPVTIPAIHEPHENVGRHNEPDPTMRSLNPFTQARNLALRSQIEVAEAIEVETTEIMRLEQAVFTFVPKKYIDYYMKELGLPAGWEIGYRTFQRRLRETAARPIHGVFQMPPGELNFRRWRLHNWPTMSQMGWCKSFCVHPSAVYAMERGGKINVSGDVLVALVEAKIMSEEQARHFASRIRHANLIRAGADAGVSSGKNSSR